MADTPKPLQIEKIKRAGKPSSIRVGAYRNPFPDLRKRKESDVDLKWRILKKNGYDLLEDPILECVRQPVSAVASMHQSYGQILGFKFNYRYWAANHALWVGDDGEHIYRFCRGSHGLLDGLVYRFHAYRAIIEKSLRFDDIHLVPSILFFGDEVGDIRKGLGKGLWKSLCKNSFTRNHLIFLRANMFAPPSYSQGVQHFGKNGKKPVIIRPDYSVCQPLLVALNGLPTSLLRETWLFERNHFDSPTELQELEPWWRHLARAGRSEACLTKSTRLRQMSSIAIDTERMARRLGQAFSYQWSANRMHFEHERMTKQLAQAKWAHQNTPFPFHHPWAHSIEQEGITALLLTTPLELLSEGGEMHHCVGSYSDLVQTGRSLIFSLRGMDQSRSTLELRVDERRHRVLVAQHTGYCNDPAPESHVRFANVVVDAQMQVYRRSPEYSLAG